MKSAEEIRMVVSFIENVPSTSENKPVSEHMDIVKDTLTWVLGD